jgi:hypothetical protein
MSVRSDEWDLSWPTLRGWLGLFFSRSFSSAMIMIIDRAAYCGVSFSFILLFLLRKNHAPSCRWCTVGGEVFLFFSITTYSVIGPPMFAYRYMYLCLLFSSISTATCELSFFPAGCQKSGWFPV